MNVNEINHVSNAVKNHASKVIMNHASLRMRERGITENEIVNCLSSGNLIECHNNVKTDVRALFRKDNQERSICVVVSLITGKVITVWSNATDDHHESLNTAKYVWACDLTKVFCTEAGYPARGR